MLLLLTLSVSFASEGPWTTAPGRSNVYIGLGYETFSEFCSGACLVGGTDQNSNELPTAVNKTYVNVFWRYGLSPKWDIALDAPVAIVWTDEDLAGDAFATTKAPGIIQARARYQFVKQGEVPVSAALRFGARAGVLHFESRNRLTNVGEGSTDIGAQVSVGRSGLTRVGGLIWSVDAGYWMRGYPGRSEISDYNGQRVPRNELAASSTVMLQPTGPVGFILAADGFYRTGGRAFSEPEWDTGSQWAELNAAQVKAGGRVMIFPTAYTPNMSVGFMYSIWAKNNPSNDWVVDLGVGFDFGRGAK